MNRLYEVFGSTFLGVDMAQYWAELPLWELFLGEHEDIRCILELGTGKGGFSLFLLMQALQRGQQFHTFDKYPPDETPLGEALNLEAHFHRGDIFGKSYAQVAAILNDEEARPALVYCDNGNKPREVRTFAPMLRAGDYLGVHDYRTEIQDEDIEPVIHLLEPVFLEECAKFRPNLTRFWRRI